MDIPGLSSLVSIFKRNIDRKNDVLAQRKEIAEELMTNCRQWSKILTNTFDRAVLKWQGPGGREAAQKEIEDQQQDFINLDYWSLKAGSHYLRFLQEDARFVPFTERCGEFYEAALSIKRIVYGKIQTASGDYVSERDVGVKGMVEAWKSEVERMLFRVTTEYHKVKTLKPI